MFYPIQKPKPAYGPTLNGQRWPLLNDARPQDGVAFPRNYGTDLPRWACLNCGKYPGSHRWMNGACTPYNEAKPTYCRLEIEGVPQEYER